MGSKDKRIDAYIAKSADFAKPILTHLRQLVHKNCPDVIENLKWSHPHFDYKGIFCAMAAFKQHVTFGFWKYSLMTESKTLLKKESGDAWGSMGRLQSLADLPSDKILIACLKEAMKLNDEGIKVPVKARPKEKKALLIPDYFMKAVSKNIKALKTFQEFSYSNKKEYVEWITDAKTEETRTTRMATAIEWMAEGKVRNWKYIKK